MPKVLVWDSSCIGSPHAFMSGETSCLRCYDWVNTSRAVSWGQHRAALAVAQIDRETERQGTPIVLSPQRRMVADVYDRGLYGSFSGRLSACFRSTSLGQWRLTACQPATSGTTGGMCLWVAAGSHDEPTASPGLAHLIEHLLFLVSRNYPPDQRLMAFVQRNDSRVNTMHLGAVRRIPGT